MIFKPSDWKEKFKKEAEFGGYIIPTPDTVAVKVVVSHNGMAPLLKVKPACPFTLP